MCKFNPKNEGRRIDPCMKLLIKSLNDSGCKTLSCCCGHGRYPASIIVDAYVTSSLAKLEIFSGIFIFRKKRFYKRDKQGYYYIPEVIKCKPNQH